MKRSQSALLQACPSWVHFIQNKAKTATSKTHNVNNTHKFVINICNPPPPSPPPPFHVCGSAHTHTCAHAYTHYCCSWCKNYSGKGGKASNVLFIFTCNASFHSQLVELLALSSLSLQHYKHGHQILVAQLQTAQVGVSTTAAKQSNPVGLGNANWHHRTDRQASRWTW